MKVCVFGLWHLGSVTSACLASLGHQVIGLDDDVNTIRKLKSGRAPIFEAGLDELIRKGLSTSNLLFTSNYEKLPNDIDFVWITIDTPIFPFLKKG